MVYMIDGVRTTEESKWEGNEKGDGMPLFYAEVTGREEEGGRE